MGPARRRRLAVARRGCEAHTSLTVSRRVMIGAVVGVVLVLAGLGSALAAGSSAPRATRSAQASLHQALARQLRMLTRGVRVAVAQRAPRAVVPGGGVPCAVNAVGCSLKPCLEFAASAQPSAVSVSAPAVEELVTPQLRSPRRATPLVRPAHPVLPARPALRAYPALRSRSACRAVPAVGQQRLVPVSLATTSASG